MNKLIWVIDLIMCVLWLMSFSDLSVREWKLVYVGKVGVYGKTYVWNWGISRVVNPS